MRARFFAVARRRMFCHSLIVFLVVAMTAPGLAAAEAKRPSAFKLFPEETVVFVRVANAAKFFEKFKEI